jgi:hypothetical protein
VSASRTFKVRFLGIESFKAIIAKMFEALLTFNGIECYICTYAAHEFIDIFLLTKYFRLL